MSKIKIVSKITNITDKETKICTTQGIYNDNRIVYKDSNTNVELILNESNIILSRTVEGISKIVFDFNLVKETFCEIDLIKENKKLQMKLSTTKINVLDSSFEINYILNDNMKFNFVLEYKEY